jgi:hypothetical protein
MDYRHNTDYDKKELDLLKNHIAYLNEIISQSGQTPPDTPILSRSDRLRVEIDEEMLDDMARNSL